MMKRVIAVVAVALACMVLLLVFCEEDVANSPTIRSNTESSPSGNELYRQAGTNRTNEPSESLGTETGGNVSSPLNPLKKLRNATEAKNVSIIFWGQVLDEMGVPIENALIQMRSRSWKVSNLLNPTAEYNTHSTVSDRNGLFVLSGMSGDVLSLQSLEKRGYIEDPDNSRTFGYNISTNVSTSKERPVVLRMLEGNGSNDLTIGKVVWELQPDGRAYYVDLETERVVEGSNMAADLKIEMSRAVDAVSGRYYDWSYTISILNGGLLEVLENSNTFFVAPTNGYQSVLEFAVQASDPRWKERVQKRFFLKMKESTRWYYGRLEVDFISMFNLGQMNSAVRIKYAINKKGDKSLF